MTLNKRFLSTALLTAAMTLVATGAAALTENQVITAPDVPLTAIEESVIPENYSPEANYYLDQDLDFDPAGYQPELSQPPEGEAAVYLNISQHPGLTASEAESAAKLLADYKAGTVKADGKAIIDPQEKVVLGVYRLPAKDYEGETIYTILPGTMLTDEQLLQLIDAWQRLGRDFDPQGLSYLNCMRGGGMDATRYATQGEYERSPLLARLQRRQGLKPDLPFTPLPSDDGNGYVTLDGQYFDGQEAFSFYPYRARSDSELMALNAYDKPLLDGAATPIIDADYPWAEAEAAAREAAVRLLKAGRALALSDEGLSEDGAYVATLESPLIAGKSELVHVVLSRDLKTVHSAFRQTFQQSPEMAEESAPIEADAALREKALAQAKAYVASLAPGQTVAEASFLGLSENESGASAVTLIQLQDGSSYRLTIGLDSEEPEAIDYNREPVPGMDEPLIYEQMDPNEVPDEAQVEAPEMDDEDLAAWAGMEEVADASFDMTLTEEEGAYPSEDEPLYESEWMQDEGTFCPDCGQDNAADDPFMDDGLAEWAGMDPYGEDAELMAAEGAWDEAGQPLWEDPWAEEGWPEDEADFACGTCGPMADEGECWYADMDGLSAEQVRWFWEGILNGWFDSLTDDVLGPAGAHDAAYDDYDYSDQGVEQELIPEAA